MSGCPSPRPSPKPGSYPPSPEPCVAVPPGTRSPEPTIAETGASVSTLLIGAAVLLAVAGATLARIGRRER